MAARKGAGHMLRELLWVAGAGGAGLVAWVAAQAWQRKREIPDMPWALCVVTVLLRAPRALGLPPFEAPHSLERAVREAMAQTGLTDLGPGAERFFAEHEQLYNGTERLHPATRRFSPTGELGVNTEMCNVVRRRLLITEYLKQHPEIRELRVHRPIIVLGLPRSGTTFLHRVLATDTSQFRAPLTWELQTPTPLTEDTTPAALAADRDAREAKADEVLRQVLDQTGDLLTNIHELDARGAEECYIALANDFPISVHMMASYFATLEKLMKEQAPPLQSYENYKNVLRLLQFQKPDDARQWLLKCPMHTAYIDTIERVFPDAILVWAHRAPTSAVPSLASLLRAVHQMFFEPSAWDPEWTGQACLSYARAVTTKAARDLASTKLRHAHVKYDELVKDPVGTVRKLYQDIELEFTPAAQQTLEEHLVKDAAKRASLKGKKKALHAYSLEDYGLTAAQVEREMQRYIEFAGL